MKNILKPLLFLLVAASILLFSDLSNRKGIHRNTEIKRVAIFKFNSNLILNETEKGLLNELNTQKIFPQNRMEITRYCPEGDLPTANTIALEIINKKYDMVISISTPGLQVMANANKAGKVIHVFCAVTDPFVSGVGITGPGKDQHPAHLTGIGTFQPVEKAFRIAREMKPDLKKVGVVWCTGETCSEACVKKARAICAELGIELIESGIESSSQVYEAAVAMTARGIQALWIGGDNVLETGMDMYVNAGMKAGIPVFNNSPYSTLKGTMFGIGANYQSVGALAGKMACEILNGKSVRDFETTNVVPEKIFINESVIKKVKGNWALPDDLRARADTVIVTGDR